MPCHCSSPARSPDGPLPRLVRALWRLLRWSVPRMARGLARLVHVPAAWLADVRAARRGPVVVAQVAQPRRARLLQRTLRQAARQHCQALGFAIPSDLVILAQETIDPFGERAALLERESRTDGATRYLLHLALAPPARPGGLSVDALIAELGRQLLRLQREVEGTSACLIGDAVAGLGLPVQGPFGQDDGHRVVPFTARYGRHADPLGRTPEHA